MWRRKSLLPCAKNFPPFLPRFQAVDCTIQLRQTSRFSELRVVGHVVTAFSSMTMAPMGGAAPMGVLLAASQANAKVAPIGQQSAVLLAMLLLGACCCCICIVQWRTLRRRRGEDGESEQEPLLSNTLSSSNVRHRQQSSDIASIGTPARDFVRLSALPAAVFQPRSAALQLSQSPICTSLAVAAPSLSLTSAFFVRWMCAATTAAAHAIKSASVSRCGPAGMLCSAGRAPTLCSSARSADSTSREYRQRSSQTTTFRDGITRTSQ